MTVLKMVEQTIKEYEPLDWASLVINKSQLLERLTVIKNALIMGDLNKDYSNEEIMKLKQLH